MYAIIVKQGLVVPVIVAFYYICLFRNPVITILKVVGCEDDVRKNNLPIGPAAGQFLQFF